jgi:acetoin utilization protein AcuB
MRAQDIMTPGIETITPQSTGQEAWDLMKREAIRHLVVKDGARMIGVVSQRDLGGRQGASLRAAQTVGDLMTPGVVTIGSTDTVRKAANLMRGRTIGSLVVTRRGRPVGIVTVSDLLDFVGRGGGRTPDRPTLSHRVAHRKRHVSAGAW